MNDDIAIKVENVGKVFKLPHQKNNSIKGALINFSTRGKTYEEQVALKDISFEIKKGEFFGIVGRNGGGKSTLLKLLAGIYSPTTGSVQVNGKLTPFIELGVGFNPELTGRENVYLNGALLGFSRKEMTNMYDDIVQFAEIERFMDQKLKNYSSGMQVRLAFSIAIRAKSDILLIDEVLAVGDTAFQRKCYEYFHGLKKAGQTVVFVSHDMGAVQTYCDRALMLQKSRVLTMGQPRDVALRYEVANISEAESHSDNIESRPKNPAIKIDAITPLNKQKPSSNFKLSEEIVVKVDFIVTKIQPVQFNLFLISQDGDYVAGVNTTRDIKNFNPKKGRNTIYCSLESSQIAKGEYSIGVGVYTFDEPAVMIDVLDPGHSKQVPSINILEKSDFQDGRFYIRGKWHNETTR